MQNFSNLFWCRTLHVSDRLTLYHQETQHRIHITGESYIYWTVHHCNNHHHHYYHHHKHQGLDPLIRSVSTVTAALSNASSVFQFFSFLAVCSGMISKVFGFVVFFASVESLFRLYSSVLSSMPVIRSSRRV